MSLLFQGDKSVVSVPLCLIIIISHIKWSQLKDCLMFNPTEAATTWDIFVIFWIQVSATAAWRLCCGCRFEHNHLSTSDNIWFVLFYDKGSSGAPLSAKALQFPETYLSSVFIWSGLFIFSNLTV